MNIFFTASLRAKQKTEFKDHIDTIYKSLNINHKVNAKHILENNLEDVERWTFDKKIKYYNSIYKEIKNCDLFIAEITYPSINVGYEIALALDVDKQVVLLYQDNNNPAILNLINTDSYVDQLHIIKYTTRNLSIIIADLLKSMNGLTDKRFTLLLPPYILNHLSIIAKKEKMPRAVYIRKLIENDMHDK